MEEVCIVLVNLTFYSIGMVFMFSGMVVDGCSAMKCRRNVTTSERGAYSEYLYRAQQYKEYTFTTLSQRHSRGLIYIRFSPLLGYLAIGIECKYTEFSVSYMLFCKYQMFKLVFCCQPPTFMVLRRYSGRMIQMR